MKASAYVFLVVALMVMSGQDTFAKGGSGSSNTQQPQQTAKTDRIELLAKMKVADPAVDDDVTGVEEPEASLKYRKKADRIKLTAEVEGFNEGDIFNMYIVVNNAEILVSQLELVGTAPARQEVEFDETTWPTGVPKDLSAGSIVRLRDAAGMLILEGTLQPK